MYIRPTVTSSVLVSQVRALSTSTDRYCLICKSAHAVDDLGKRLLLFATYGSMLDKVESDITSATESFVFTISN
jgi:hypothetical protein